MFRSAFCDELFRVSDVEFSMRAMFVVGDCAMQMPTFFLVFSVH